MKYSNKFYKDIEQLSYNVYKESKYKRPEGWYSVKVYENKKNGFYAEAFENKNGQKVLVYRGTDTSKGINEMRKDLGADLKLGISEVPQQAEDAYKAYEDIKSRYGKESVMVAGYSLGGSLAQIICNETGAEGVTFAAYGVGDIVTPKNTNQIINFGNESDPIYNINFKNQIGKSYVMPDKSDLMHKGSSFEKHKPNNIGDLADATLKINTKNNTDNYIKKYYNDNLLIPSNRVFYENEMKIKDMDDETLKQFVNQYYDDNYKFPKKEELDRRTNFGELIHVEDYVKGNGTKVNGYYRHCPQK